LLEFYRSFNEIRVFFLVWIGQCVSLIGSRLTAFGLNLWIYQQTGSVTNFGLLILCSSVPGLLLSPVTGVFVDRWSRRWTMIVADSCVGLCTLTVAWLFATDHLSIWTLYGITALSSCFEAFQSTAYLSATTLLVPKDQLIRASGLTRLGGAVAKIIAPFVAGILLEVIHLEGIILIDFATLIVALVPLVLLRFPEIGDDGELTQPQPFFEAVVYGWQYLITRPGLLGLMIFLAASNVVIGAFSVLSTPLILTLTSPTGLGTVLSISSCGLVVGSLLMGIWKSQAHQIKTLFGCMVAAGLFIVVSGLRPSVYLFTIADFFLCMMFPIITGLVQVIFQKKVAPEVQGRVFSLQEPLATAGITLGYAIAGPLDELVFEPLMTSDGLLANTFVQMIGLGPGRGIALLDIVMGGLLVIATLCVYQYPRLRQLEDELPDETKVTVELSA